MRKITRTSLLLAVSVGPASRDNPGPCRSLRYATTPVCFLHGHGHQDCHAASYRDPRRLVFGVSLDGRRIPVNVQTNSEGTERLASNPPSPAKFWITH